MKMYDLFKQLQQCTSGTFNQELKKCFDCHKQCKCCSEDNNQYACTSCKDSMLDYIKEDGLCHCKSGQFWNGNTCSACTATHGNCIKCSQEVQYETQSTCLECEQNVIPYNSVCDCTGMDNIDNTANCTCLSGFQPVYNQNNKMTGCQCPAGKFKNNAGNCQDCSTGCNSCTSDSLCQQCKDNYNLINNNCVCKTLNYDISNPTSPQCLDTCIDGAESQFGQCVCKDDKYFDPEINQCTTQCSIGYYPENSTKSCQKCIDGCQQCSSITDCKKCNKDIGLILNFYQCKHSCYSNQYQNQETNECIDCKVGCLKCDDGENCRQCQHDLLLSNGQCVYQCPEQTALVFKQEGSQRIRSCEQCPEFCKECLDKDTCVKCNSQYYLHQNKCIDNCRSGFVPDNSQESKVCHPCEFRSLYESCSDLITGELFLDYDKPDIFYFMFNMKVQFEENKTVENYIDFQLQDLHYLNYKRNIEFIDDQIIKVTLSDYKKWYHESLLTFKLKNVNLIKGLTSQRKATFDLERVGKNIIFPPYEESVSSIYLLLEILFIFGNIACFILLAINRTKRNLIFISYLQVFASLIFVNQYLPKKTVAFFKSFVQFLQFNLWPNLKESGYFDKIINNRNILTSTIFWGQQITYQDINFRPYQRMYMNGSFFLNGFPFFVILFLIGICFVLISALSNKYQWKILKRLKTIFSYTLPQNISFFFFGPLIISSFFQLSVYNEDNYNNAFGYFMSLVVLNYYVFLGWKMYEALQESSQIKEDDVKQKQLFNEQQNICFFTQVYSQQLEDNQTKHSFTQIYILLIFYTKQFLTFSTISIFHSQGQFVKFLIVVITLVFIFSLIKARKVLRKNEIITMFFSEIIILVTILIMMRMDSIYSSMMYNLDIQQQKEKGKFDKIQSFSPIILILGLVFLINNFVALIFDIKNGKKMKQIQQKINEVENVDVEQLNFHGTQVEGRQLQAN